jgi:leader peptidase (prepilin peptidase) / N-methyltransferase
MIVAIALGIVGAVLASFVGVIVERINTGASWGNDRSRCDACSVTLTGRDLIPVVSWVLSLGSCRSCGSRIPARHAFVESLTALAFVSAYSVLGLGLPLAAFLSALLVLLFIVLYDMRHTIVPMRPVLSFVFLALVFRGR